VDTMKRINPISRIVGLVTLASIGLAPPALAQKPERDLTQAQSNLVAANSTYEKARVELDRATGATLDRLGILMNDAERGQVTRMPNVPYVAPRPPDQQTPVQPPAPPQQ